jgi:hypothetical protein
MLTRKAAEDARAAEQKEGVSAQAWRESNNPTITVVSENFMTTEADDESILENDVIDLQKTVSISFSYTNYRSGKSISLRLQEAEEYYSQVMSLGVV